MPHGMNRRTVLGGLAGAAAWGAAGSAAAANTVTLTFLHFNDVYRHGPAGGHGGLAEMATLIADERAHAPGPVFQTFGGDVLSPSITSSVTQGAHMIELLGAMGTDLAVVGNHEFDFGSDVMAARIAEAHFPWLGANVLGADGRPFGTLAATLMREADGLKVGFVGVLTRDTARLCPHADGVAFTDEAAALRDGAVALRRAGADLVVAMTHQDLEADIRMARSVPGIDLILGGHDHEPTEMQNAPGVPVLKSASDARWLAVAVLRVARPDPAAGAPARVRSVGWKLVPNVDVVPDPHIAAIVDAVNARTEGVLAQPLARLDVPLDSRTATVRTGEAAVGDLVADALRGYFKADIALFNGGGLRGDRLYPAGHVLSRRDLIGEMPFGNVVEELEVTGAVLLQALEHGLSGIEEGAGRFPQVSGLAFSYDPVAPHGSRLGPVLVAGVQVEPGRAYRLATTDYLAAGGDGYGMLKAARVLVDSSGGPLLVNVVAEAVQAAGRVNAAPDGRGRPVVR